jgi:PadR family transcriptional regulator
MNQEFETGGYASCESETVSGRERKVYTITDKGREAFKVALDAWLAMAKCLQKCKPLVGGDFKEGSSCCDSNKDWC